MPIPIAAALLKLRNIYFKWKIGKAAFEEVQEAVTPGEQDQSGIVNNAVSVKSDMPSTALEWVRFNPVTSRLDVKFRNRPRAPVYIFSSVPRLTWLGLLRAGSKGSYYHARVKQFSDVI